MKYLCPKTQPMLWSILLLHIVVVAWIYLWLLAPVAYAQVARLDAPPFAQPGPFAVSARDFVIEAGDATPNAEPLPVTVWFPAEAPSDASEVITYALDAGPFVGSLPTPSPTGVYADLAPTATGAPYPMVVFAHGNPGSRHLQLFLPEHLASYGFVVIAADHPGTSFVNFVSANIDPSYEQAYMDARPLVMAQRPRDMLRELAFLESLNGAGALLEDLINPEQIAITGFSAGGAAALGAAGARISFSELAAWCEQELPAPHAATVCDFQLAEPEYASIFGLERLPANLYPAVTDPRVDALVTLGAGTAIPLYGTSGLAELTVPSLLIYGTADSVVNHDHNTVRAFEHIGSRQKALVALENADHFVFTNACSEAWLAASFPFELCSDSVWDMARAQDIIKHMTTAFLLDVFAADNNAKAALEPPNVNFTGVTYTSVGY
ncbi:MAG: alpha/beta fold hydrolase [Deinococcota bacterium]